jgi:RNA polymerase sigma-70 factor (ECF subfamily)
MPVHDPDLVLCQRAQQRDQVAFEHLRVKYRRVVLKVIQNRVYHGIGADDLDDLDQRVWIEVWRSLPNFRASSTFLTWLFSLTGNVVLDWIGRKRREIPTVEEIVYDTHSDDGEQDRQTLRDLTLYEAIKNLSATEREVICLSYLVQLTNQEISEQLGLPLGTVKSRIRAGLIKLRTNMQIRDTEEKAIL